MIFKTHVQGIPCQCVVTGYTPVIPARIYGPLELCHPEEGGELEFELLDRRGRFAQWLHNKLTEADITRIEEEALVCIRGQELAMAEPDDFDPWY